MSGKGGLNRCRVLRSSEAGRRAARVAGIFPGWCLFINNAQKLREILISQRCNLQQPRNNCCIIPHFSFWWFFCLFKDYILIASWCLFQVSFIFGCSFNNARLQTLRKRSNCSYIFGGFFNLIFHGVNSLVKASQPNSTLKRSFSERHNLKTRFLY